MSLSCGREIGVGNGEEILTYAHFFTLLQTARKLSALCRTWAALNRRSLVLIEVEVVQGAPPHGLGSTRQELAAAFESRLHHS